MDDLIFLEPTNDFYDPTNKSWDEDLPDDTPDQIKEINEINRMNQVTLIDDQPLSDLDIDVKDLSENEIVEIRIIPDMTTEYNKMRIKTLSSFPSAVDKLRQITQKIMKRYPELGVVISMKLASKYMEKTAEKMNKTSEKYQVYLKGANLLERYVKKMLKMNPLSDKKSVTKNIAKYLYYY